MASAFQALKMARTLLNDDLGITWNDAVLFPKLQQAFGELMLELRVNGVEDLLRQSTRITVPARTTNLVTAGLQPVNMIYPMEIDEAAVGDQLQFFTPMVKLTFPPIVDYTPTIDTWAWINDSIMFSGAYQSRDIIIRYMASISTPQIVSQDLGVVMAEMYIAPRVAAIAKESIGSDSSRETANAEKALYKIIQASTTEDQRPRRRKRYRSRKGLLPGTSIPRNY